MLSYSNMKRLDLPHEEKRSSFNVQVASGGSTRTATQDRLLVLLVVALAKGVDPVPGVQDGKRPPKHVEDEVNCSGPGKVSAQQPDGTERPAEDNEVQDDG